MMDAARAAFCANKMRNKLDMLGFLSTSVVLLTLLPTSDCFGSVPTRFKRSEGSDTGKVSGGCPTGMIYCFMRERCILQNGNCPLTPVCKYNEKLTWNPAGYEECVPLPLEPTCDSTAMDVCSVDGELTCVARGDCKHLEVYMILDADFHSHVGENYQHYLTFVDRMKGQLINHLNLSPSEIWSIVVWKGSINLFFKSVTTASIDSKLDQMKNKNVQFFRNEQGDTLQIDWTQLFIATPGQGDGEYTCGENKMTCYKDGELKCTDDGTCDHFSVTLTSDRSDIILGSTAESYASFLTAVRSAVATKFQLETVQVWDVWSWTNPTNGMLMIHFKIVTWIKEELYRVFKTDNDQFLTDGDGGAINWSEVDVSRPGQVPCGHGGYHCDGADGGHQKCGTGEIFCLMRNKCVTMNVEGTCTTTPVKDICAANEVPCWVNDKSTCVPTGNCATNTATVSFKLDGDLEQVKGKEKEFIIDIAKQLSIDESVIKTLGFSFGSIVVTMTLGVGDGTILPLVKEMVTRENLSIAGTDYAIQPGSWHIHTDNANQNDTDDDDGDGDVDESYKGCPVGQIFCLMKNKCVTKNIEGTCTTTPVINICAANEVPCWANDKSTCVPTGKCDIKSATVIFKLNGNISDVAGKELDFIDGIANAGKFVKSMIETLTFSPGSIVVTVVMKPISEASISEALSLIKVVLTRPSISISGTKYTIQHNSMWITTESGDGDTGDDGAEDDRDAGWDKSGGAGWSNVGDYSGDKGKACPVGQIFCLMRNMCVTLSTERACTTPPVTTTCQENEEPCWDQQIQCVPKGHCDINAATVMFKLYGDISEVVGKESEFIDSIADQIKVDKSVIVSLQFSPGSIVVTINIKQNNGVSISGVLLSMQAVFTRTDISIAGNTYDIYKDSLEINAARVDDGTDGDNGDNGSGGNGSDNSGGVDGWGNGDGHGGASGKVCPVGLIFCLMRNMCVTLSTERTCSTPPVTTTCPENEEPCWDQQIQCVPKGHCDINAATVAFKLYGNVSEAFGKESDFIDSIANQIKVDKSVIASLQFSPGSIVVTINIKQNKGVSISGVLLSMQAIFTRTDISIAGNTYDIYKDSLEINTARVDDGTDGDNGDNGSGGNGSDNSGGVDGWGNGDDHGGASGKVCPVGQIFCLMRNMCVTPSTKRVCSTPPVTTTCPENEEPCWDQQLQCVPKGHCDINAATVMFRLYGDISEVVGKESEFIDSIANQIKVDKSVIMSLQFSPGSIVVTIYVKQNNGVSISSVLLSMQAVFTRTDITIAGNTYDIYKNSLEINGARVDDGTDGDNGDNGSGDNGADNSGGVDGWGNGGDHGGESGKVCPFGKIFCLMRSMCVTLSTKRACSTPPVTTTCPENEVACRSETDTTICVSREMCKVIATCPDVKTDTSLACDSSEDCEVPTGKDIASTGEENDQNQLCCANNCDGTQFVIPVITFDCKDSAGVCLSDSSCTGENVWCSETKTCIPQTEKCGNDKSIEEEIETEYFVIKMAVIFNPVAPEETSLEERLTGFADHLRQYLQTQFDGIYIENRLLIDEVTVQPGRAIGENILIFAMAHAIKDDIDTAHLKESLQALKLTDTDGTVLNHVENEEPRVFPVSRNTRIYTLPRPVIKGQVNEFTPIEVLPTDVMAKLSNGAVLDCSSVQTEFPDGSSNDMFTVKKSDGTFSSVADVSPTNAIAIANHEDDIMLKKCELKLASEEESDMRHFVAFLAIPMSPNELANDIHVSLNEDIDIEINEDTADCVHLPEDIFHIQVLGDALYARYSDWAEQMVSANENWITPKGASLALRIQEFLIHYSRMRTNALEKMRAKVKVSEETRYWNQGKELVAKLKYRDTDGSTNVLTSPGNVQVCVAADFSGTFDLEIERITSSATTLTTEEDLTPPILKLPVTVNAVFDAPTLKRRGDEVSNIFVYNQVSAQTEDTFQVFPVSDIAAEYCEDSDPESNLGLAIAAGKGAVWEMSRDELNWEAIPDEMKEFDGTVGDTTIHQPVQLLHGDAKLKVTPFSEKENVTWLKEDAPSLTVMCWDASTSTSGPSPHTAVISLKECSSSSSVSYCHAIASDEFSEVVEVFLTRKGCDGVADSGLDELECGCAIPLDACADCNDVPHGDAKVDMCGVCGGHNTEIKCNVTECYSANKQYCDDAKTVKKLCEDGYKESPHPRCPEKCYPVGTDFTDLDDDCGETCGTNKCFDCRQEAYGVHHMDTCGECVVQGEDCNDGIGKTHPAFSFTWAQANVTVEAAPGLLPGSGNTPDITCQLVRVETSLTGVITPSVTRVYSKGNILTLSLKVASEEVEQSAGTFAIVCNIPSPTGGEPVTVSTLDSGSIYKRYRHPILQTAVPDQLQFDLSSTPTKYITIHGNNFVNTGVVFCLLRCGEMDDVCNGFKQFRGEWVSETEVKCSTAFFTSERSGQTYEIYVILDDKDNLDLPVTLSQIPVQLTVVLPAPTVVQAVVDSGGCNTVDIFFNRPVSFATTTERADDCSLIFDADTITTYGITAAKCRVVGRKIHIEGIVENVEGGTLTFGSALIDSAETNTNNAQRVIGSVTVETKDGSGENLRVKIDPKINTNVGCKAAYMKAVIENKGCRDIHMSWTVAIEGADLSDVEIVNAAQLINSRIQNKQEFSIKKEHLVAGADFVFTLVWSASGGLGGTDTKILRRDNQSSFALKITSPKDGVDVTKVIAVKARVVFCSQSVTEKLKVTWTLVPKVARLASGIKTYLKENTLKPGTQYTLTCTVASTSATITFTTQREKPIAAISVNNGHPAPNSEYTQPFDNDMVLTCADKAPSATSDSDHTCVWTCLENVHGNDENDFYECRDRTTISQEPLVLSDKTVTIVKESRTQPQDWDLSQWWKVTMKTDGEESTAKIKVKFRSSQVQIVRPEIKRRRDTMMYIDKDSTVVIEAKIKYATSFLWTSNVQGFEDYGSINIEDVVAADIRVKGDITFSETRYKKVSLKIESSDTMLKGYTYAVTLHVFNEIDGEYLETTEIFYLQVVPVPIAGTVEVLADTTPITALTTKLSIKLSGWWDPFHDSDYLDCLFYYRNVDDQADVHINTYSNLLDEAVTELMLPEGVFTIKATCCNGPLRCSTSQTADTITVLPFDPLKFMDIVRSMITDIMTDQDSVLQLIRDTIAAKAKLSLSESDDEEATLAIEDAANDGIQQQLASSVHLDITEKKSERIDALRSAVDIGSSIKKSEATKEKMQETARDIGRDATGKDTTKGSRKKRSTVVYEDEVPVGMTESEAVVLLTTFDTTIDVSSSEPLEKADAQRFKETIYSVMLGMCQAFNEVDPWVAGSIHVTVRAHRVNVDADTQYDVSCDGCQTITKPAKVKYGSHLGSTFNGSWDCAPSDQYCTDVCVASVQITLDTITPTAEPEIEPPKLTSDIVITQLINPHPPASPVESSLATNLNDPVELTIALNETADISKHSYKCKMWDLNDWSDDKCTSSTPTLDGSTYEIVCSCTELGIVGVFEEDPENVITTSTETPTNPPPTTTTSTLASTTKAPAKPLLPGTGHLDVKFTFNDDYYKMVMSNTEFCAGINTQLVSQSKHPSSCYKNVECKPGSIIVTFQLHTSTGSPSLGQMAYTLETMFAANSLTFTSPEGTTLNVKAGSFSYSEKSTSNDDDDDDDGDSTSVTELLPYIVGGALGGLAILGAIIVAVVFILKNNKNPKTFPARPFVDPQTSRSDQLTPPPAYGLAPPPPYIYSPPTVQERNAYPEANKWIENEMQKHEAERRSNRSNSSSSVQRLIRQKVEREPTPVGE